MQNELFGVNLVGGTDGDDVKLSVLVNGATKKAK